MPDYPEMMVSVTYEWYEELTASVVSNMISVDTRGADLVVEHTVVDDKVIETLLVPTSGCLLVGTLTFQPAEVDTNAPQAEIEQVEAAASPAVELVGSDPIPPSGVETAEYAVGVGRGVNKPELFEEAKKLTGAIGAEMSGSMPGVKNFGYFEEGSDYVGLSGVRLNAKLYVALGISGSTPHLPGMLNVGTVVAVNNDANAQIFNHADYGIVGDVAEVVPAFTAAPR